MANEMRFVTAAWQIMDELHKNEQIESTLAKIVETLCVNVGCEEGYVWLRGADDNRLYLIAGKGSSDQLGISVKIGEGLIGTVFQGKESKVFENGAENPDYADFEEIALFGKKTLLTPMYTPHGFYGVIMLNNPRDDEFGEDDKRLAENISALIALDLEDKGVKFDVSKKGKPLLSLRGIIKEFMNGDEVRRVLKGIDLDVYEGELLVVLGESGCGKSTMLNIIGGMDRATDGSIMIEGRDFSSPTEDELTKFRRDYIGFIFQSYNLMPNLTALENIEFIAEIAQNPLSSEEMLKMVDLGDKAETYPSAMSGGQQQRVCIARAIVKDPKIILADEPTAALDFRTGQDVLKLIETIVRDRKTTVIMVTHNIEIAKMANRVIRLKDGMISSMRVNLSPMHARDLSW